MCNPASGECEAEPDAPGGTPCDTDNDPGSVEECDGGGQCQPDCEAMLPSFKGYTLNRRKGFVPIDVMLADQFEVKDTTVTRPKYLANPAGIDGSGIDDPTAHMMCYRVKDVTGQALFTPVNVRLESRFGTDLVTAVKSDLLCVPAKKDLVPLTSTFDRFKCYRLRSRKGAPRFVKQVLTVNDQFESKVMKTFRPFLLCNPVSKDGEEIQEPVCHVTCYKISDEPGQPRFIDRDALIEDEFGTQNVGTNTNVRETCHRSAVLCVPSLKFHE